MPGEAARPAAMQTHRPGYALDWEFVSWLPTPLKIEATPQAASLLKLFHSLQMQLLLQAQGGHAAEREHSTQRVMKIFLE